MRKFLIRWWYTPNWQADTYARMIRHWNEDTGLGSLFLDEYSGKWEYSEGTEHVPDDVIREAIQREIRETELTVYDDHIMHDSEGLKLRKGQEWELIG